MINVNSDNTISKDEISNYQKTQSDKSIFTDYFNSLDNDVSVDEFANKIYYIWDKSGEKTPKLHFKSKEAEENYNNLTNEAIRQEISEYYKYCKNFMWKTLGQEDYDKLFKQFLNECKPNFYKIPKKFEDLELTQPISMQSFKDSRLYDIELSTGKALPDIDWSHSSEIFKYLSYDDKTFSETSPEHLPEGYDPKTVFENGKTIGLNIDKVHERGYDGSGVSYAIIDSGVEQHSAIHFKEYHVSDLANKQMLNHFHGYAVSYIAQEIAPNADCYYYAAQNGRGIDAPVLDNLKSILEKNKNLPEDKKIRFVSMSMPLYGGEEAKKVIEELETQGVWVFYSGCKDDDKFGYLGKKDAMADPNDFDNYQIEQEAVTEPKLYVNSGDRTVPSPLGENSFRHDSRASQSWSVPVIAGYYTLACQTDPSMTKEKFLRLAEETAQVKQSNSPKYVCIGNPQDGDSWVIDGRTENTQEIKIIDIDALLHAIEKEKSQPG